MHFLIILLTGSLFLLFFGLIVTKQKYLKLEDHIQKAIDNTRRGINEIYGILNISELRCRPNAGEPLYNEFTNSLDKLKKDYKEIKDYCYPSKINIENIVTSETYNKLNEICLDVRTLETLNVPFCKDYCSGETIKWYPNESKCVCNQGYKMPIPLPQTSKLQCVSTDKNKIMSDRLDGYQRESNAFVTAFPNVLFF